ncbi:MAG: hypothetical protein JWQ35_2652 [Bacteriovoracaceae bacterium]|nr:hypothetical protein [Bacteriovoracaceae bacterium]
MLRRGSFVFFVFLFSFRLEAFECPRYLSWLASPQRRQVLLIPSMLRQLETQIQKRSLLVDRSFIFSTSKSFFFFRFSEEWKFEDKDNLIAKAIESYCHERGIRVRRVAEYGYPSLAARRLADNDENLFDFTQYYLEIYF